MSHPTSKERREAIRAGQSIFQGNPCKRGHDGRRYVRNWGCVSCANINRKRFAANNPGYDAERFRSLRRTAKRIALLIIWEEAWHG